LANQRHHQSIATPSDPVVLEKVGIAPQSKTKKETAPLSTILKHNLDGAPFQGKWDYPRISGKLKFLKKSTCLEIAYMVHQYAHFATNVRQLYANAVKYLQCRTVLATKDKDIILGL
jgi:hypothetical protein